MEDCFLLLAADRWHTLRPPPAADAGAAQRLLLEPWTDWAHAVACERLCSLFERFPVPRAGRAWRDKLDPRLAHVQLPAELSRQRSDLNRGACKLRGLDLSLGGAITAALGLLPENAAVDLCGGPGGWVQALAAHRRHGTLFLCSTWTGSPTPNSWYNPLLRAWGSAGGPDLTNVLLDAGGADDTDLRRPEAVARLRLAWTQQLRDRDLPCTLVLGDGGAPEAADQERRGVCMLAAQLGTHWLLAHGPAGEERRRALLVCKFFGWLGAASQLALAAAVLAFDEWCVVKPVASRSANAEAYLACRGPACPGGRAALAERVLGALHGLGPAPAAARAVELAEQHGVLGALLAFREQFPPRCAPQARKKEQPGQGEGMDSRAVRHFVRQYGGRETIATLGDASLCVREGGLFCRTEEDRDWQPACERCFVRRGRCRVADSRHPRFRLCTAHARKHLRRKRRLDDAEGGQSHKRRRRHDGDHGAPPASSADETDNDVSARGNQEKVKVASDPGGLASDLYGNVMDGAVKRDTNRETVEEVQRDPVGGWQRGAQLGVLRAARLFGSSEGGRGLRVRLHRRAIQHRITRHRLHGLASTNSHPQRQRAAIPANALLAADTCLSCSARAQLQAMGVATCSNGMVDSLNFGHEQASLLGFESLSSFEHYTSFVTLAPLTILLVVYGLRLCSGRAALAWARNAKEEKIYGIITTYQTEETVGGCLLFLASITFLSVHLSGIGLPAGMLRWGPKGTPNTVFSLYAILGLIMVDWSVLMVARALQSIGRDAFMIYKGLAHLAISAIYGIMYSWLPEAQNGVVTVRLLGVTAMVASSLVYMFFIPYELWVYGSDRDAVRLLEVMKAKEGNAFNTQGLVSRWGNLFPGWYAYSRRSAYLTVMHEKNIGAMSDLVFMAGLACQYAGGSKNHHWLQFALIDNYHCVGYKILFVAAATLGLALFVYALFLLCVGERTAYIFCSPPFPV
eukprot:g26832.t1